MGPGLPFEEPTSVSALASGEADAFSLASRFNHAEGVGWIADLPPELAVLSDNMTFPCQSRLVVLEDDKPLARRHAAHDDIKFKGHGAYSHWYDYLLFSTSDNSDPNSNGRHYSYRIEPETPWVLSFGSCHVNDAVLLGFSTGERARPVISMPTYTLSVPEALQQMAFYRNEFQPNDDEIDFCMSYSATQVAMRGHVDRADIVFLEICSPYPVYFGSTILSRKQIVEKIVAPIQELASDCSHFVTEWYYDGIIRQNEPVRLEFGAKLLENLPQVGAYDDVVQAIIREARIKTQSKEDLRESIIQFCELFPNSVVIALSHNLRYMPDGRPVSWPGSFYRDVNEVCGELGLPIFNTRELVAAQGPEFSLTPDLGHYTTAFYHLMADHLYEMIRKVTPGAADASSLLKAQL